VSYFIPGVRHVTGYFSGITDIPYKKFALNSYIGALIWTSTFISLGKILGNDWEKFHTAIKKYLIIGGLIAAVVIILVYVYRYYRNQISSYLVNLLGNSTIIFNSLGKMKFAIAIFSAAFLGFCVLVAGLIQDYLAHEFNQFDEIVSMLTGLIFSEKWSYFMKLSSYLTSPGILVTVALLLLVFILFRHKNKLLEIRFLFITIPGGELLEELLRLLFHRQGPPNSFVSSKIIYTFPGEHALMAVIVYGFAAYLLLRHLRIKWLKAPVIIIAFVICILLGLSPLFFHTEYPSDAAAGYVFGGLWLSLNIVLLEIYRILPRVQFKSYKKSC
jgi:hypothetical protein